MDIIITCTRHISTVQKDVKTNQHHSYVHMSSCDRWEKIQVSIGSSLLSQVMDKLNDRINLPEVNIIYSLFCIN